MILIKTISILKQTSKTSNKEIVFYLKKKWYSNEKKLCKFPVSGNSFWIPLLLKIMFLTKQILNIFPSPANWKGSLRRLSRDSFF